jgi:hypothetical protein
MKFDWFRFVFKIPVAVHCPGVVLLGYDSSTATLAS